MTSDGSATSFLVRSAGLAVTATWSGDPRLVSAILGRRIATAGASHPARAAAAAAAGRGPAARPAAIRAPVAHAAGVFDGLGFDACATPSAAVMADWTASPYRAVGVYVGGVNEACAQPSLDAAWVTGEIAAGWHLIPTYVGYQGAGSCGGTCATISPAQATAEGTDDAAAAVSNAQAVGIAPGNPIYDDMEQFSASPANNAAVLAYLAAWTAQLHAAGYLSGVYGSGSSAITDLVYEVGTGDRRAR